ncbi:MAG TPA: potassium channel family protein [Bacteroidales bacterium]|nr:potassium channel family protein [Bacteroidales bacterium]
MVTGYSNYKVEVKNVKFISDDGRICPRTAIVTLFGHDGEQAGTELFGAIDTSEIYKMIEEGSEINLDNFYISEFSLANYRRYRNLEKKEPVAMRKFTAKNAFFESKNATDFSYSSFTDDDIDFDGTHFARGKVIFTGTNWGKGNVIFSNTLFRDGNIEFNGSVFGDGDFLFKNAIVKDGIKDFQDIKFGDGEVSFANTEFNYGELLFINTQFGNGRFNFKVTRIAGGKVDFHYSAFGDCEVTFERAEFGNSRVDFRTVDFGSGRINFNRTIFGNGEVNFEGASCSSGKIQFKKAEMGAGPKNFSLMEMVNTEINFEKTEFGDGDVVFNNSRFKELSLKSCHLDHYFDLRLAGAGLLDISDTIIRDIVDLEPYDFKIDIKVLDMSGMRIIGKLYIDWNSNECRNVITAQPETTIRQKAEQFRILKTNFSSTGKYDDEDKAYVEFKRFEADADMQDGIEKSKWARLWEYPVYGFKWLVFDKIGLYATSPGRVLLSVVIFWLFFGSTYYLMQVIGLGKITSSVGNPDHLTTLVQSFYHSAITFFTIGYGDTFPEGASRIVAGLEGFMGVFMMSYFTVAFVRKVLR